jgi:hypothetical protein
MATDNAPITATPPADPSLKEDAIYSPSHLDRIRELYIQGNRIALPAQLEKERANLDEQRAAFEKTQANAQGSTDATGVATLRTSSTNAGSTAAPTSSTPAGTAGSSTSATK